MEEELTTVASQREKKMPVIDGYNFQRYNHKVIYKDGSVNWRCQHIIYF